MNERRKKLNVRRKNNVVVGLLSTCFFYSLFCVLESRYSRSLCHANSNGTTKNAVSSKTLFRLSLIFHLMSIVLRSAAFSTITAALASLNEPTHRRATESAIETGNVRCFGDHDTAATVNRRREKKNKREAKMQRKIATSKSCSLRSLATFDVPLPLNVV